MQKTTTARPAFPGPDVTGEAFASGLLALFAFTESESGICDDNGLDVAAMVEARGRIDDAVAAVEARIDALYVRKETGTLTDREYAEYDKAGHFLSHLEIIRATPISALATAFDAAGLADGEAVRR